MSAPAASPAAASASAPGAAVDSEAESALVSSALSQIRALSPHSAISAESRRVALERTGCSMHFLQTGPPVTDAACVGVMLFVHGWPDWSFGWRYQLACFAAEGFHCIAVDQRGFGLTRLLDADAAKHTANFTWSLAAADLACLLDQLQIRSAIVVGHDWGGATAWSFARRYPERTRAVVSLCTPYRPAKKHFISPEAMASLLPIMHYQRYFARERVAAAAELDNGRERALRCLFRTGDRKDQAGGFMTAASSSFMQHFPLNPKPSPLLTEAEFQLYCDAFKLSGFSSSLCWYGTSRLNWEEESWRWRDGVLDVRSSDWRKANCQRPRPPAEFVENLSPLVFPPALMVTAGADAVLKPSMTLNMEQWCPQLQRAHIEGAAHWVAMEKPDSVNDALLRFIESLPQWTNERMEHKGAAGAGAAVTRKAKL